MNLAPAPAATTINRPRTHRRHANRCHAVQHQRNADRARQDDPKALPLLVLAPMENLADRPFRVSHAQTLGGYDEACMEFMRVPTKAERPAAAVRGACSHYDAYELSAYRLPLGAQIMGSNPVILGMAARYLACEKRAPRVDLNCGCPANSVTGNGAGSSLLRSPELLHRCVEGMVEAAGNDTLITVKMRAGYLDTALFEENLLAAQEAGAQFVTLHARTKQQAYEGRADWDLIARARQLLRIPIIGNGDVVSVSAARQLLKSGCQGLCIGRGAVQDPLLFLRIRASFEQPDLPWEWNEPEVVQAFLRSYAAHAFNSFKPHQVAKLASQTAKPTQDSSPSTGETGANACRSECKIEETSNADSAMSERSKFGRLKKVMKYLFNSSPELAQSCDQILRVQPGTGMSAEELVEVCCQQIQQHWPASGPSRLALFNHMTKQRAERVVVLAQTA